jgi:hypothetical protein
VVQRESNRSPDVGPRLVSEAEIGWLTVERFGLQCVHTREV